MVGRGFCFGGGVVSADGDMEASQTREYCAAKSAAHRAARLGPSATMKPSLQDDKAKNMRSSATIRLSLQDDNLIDEGHRNGWDHDLGGGGIRIKFKITNKVKGNGPFGCAQGKQACPFRTG